MEFIESDALHIEVDISAPSVDELSLVHHNYTDYKGSVLLQLVSSLASSIV